MKFTSIVDLVKYFVYEYSKPGDKALLIGMVSEIMEIRRIFYFVENELTIINNVRSDNIDLFVENMEYIPFENESFDFILNLKDNEVNPNLLKHGGVILNVDNTLNYNLFEKK